MTCGFRVVNSDHCFNDDGECIVCHVIRTDNDVI